MKKTFAPPLAKSHVLSSRKGPEHHGKKEDARAKEAITHPLSQGMSYSSETKLKEDHPNTEVKRWKKSRVAKEEDTGHVKGPGTPQDVEKRPKRNLTKASAKEMCHLTDLQFEEIVQSVLQKSLQECMEESKRPFHQAEATEAAEPQGLKKETFETSRPAGSLVPYSDEPKGTVSAVDLKDPLPKAKKRNKLSLNKMRKETHEGPEAYKERRKRHRKGEPKKIVQGYTLITDQEETEEGGESTFNQCVAWVQCSYPSCEKWRRLSSNADPSVLPEDWTCSQNTDPQYKSCDVPEETWSGSENEVVYATYVPGSIIWAKQFGYPWWPAMVECDPDIGEYFLFSSRLDSLPSKYHVTFFGQSISRAWISATMLRNFHEFSTDSLGLTLRSKDYRQKLDSAVRMAKEAERISIQERVMRFGFVSRSGEGGLLEAHEDSEELFNVAREPSEEKQPCDGNENMVATSDFEEKTFLKGLKKKLTVPGSNSSGSSQPKSAAGGNRVNLTPSCRDSLKPELVKTLQVKDNTTRSHPRSSSSDEILEEFQELGELEQAKEARGSQEAEKNESSEECSLVLFEE
ncbi:zinc finger CW-type PWWP domain protein 1 isoform X2 [Gopherus flavomarginatus]|uniref:zinc finger CW-type PWWP domain protein 1 isoform X2 n=1 Tax=Gopherus flavomarginatus TaxID=286002 RepID=UPI0021CBC0B8|nr:zinc finger CW-type PWWP domain protein 1 isoform X2 [Gopherus flavomarginatus]